MPTTSVQQDPLQRDASISAAPDAAAFEKLVTDYESRIYNYVYRLMGSGAEDARDLTQDVFLKAWLAMATGRYCEQTKLQAWLYRIATNVCLDALRHRQLVKWTPWEALMSALTPHKHTRLFVSLDPQDDPERVTAAGENAADVERALATLPTKYRTCLILREFHDLSYNEMAEVLDTSRSAIKSLLFRARERFRVVWPTVAA